MKNSRADPELTCHYSFVENVKMYSFQGNKGEINNINKIKSHLKYKHFKNYFLQK